MYKTLLPVLMSVLCIALLAACAPSSSDNVRTSRFYDVGDNGIALTTTAGLNDQQRSETLNFQAGYEDVFYQAMRVARSMTMQQDTSLENWFSDNWYLASVNELTGDIIVTQNISVCQQDRPDTCLPFQNAVKISVRGDSADGSMMIIQASDWHAASTEAQFVNYYMNVLTEAIN